MTEDIEKIIDQIKSENIQTLSEQLLSVQPIVPAFVLIGRRGFVKFDDDLNKSFSDYCEQAVIDMKNKHKD